VTYKPGDEGVLFASGDNTGGYALYVQESKLKFHYRWLTYKEFHVESETELPEGELELAFDFVLTRPGVGIGRLLINDQPNGNVLIESQPLFHGGSFCIGRFPFVSVTGDMKRQERFPYTNRIDRVEFNLTRPVGDMEMILEVEQALRNE
jgi:arylsulfatase